MKFSDNIRAYFTPNQPTISRNNQDVVYQELLPDLKLQKFIYCYWTLHTMEPLEKSFTYRVVADGCIDVFFELSKPNESFVMGFCKQYTEFELASSFNYIGIRFLPSMFTQLFKVDASELSNRDQPLDLVVPDLAKYIQEHFLSSTTLDIIQELLDAYFQNYLYGVELDEDDRFYNALQIIFKQQGALHVEKDLNTGLSPRQLRRKFQYYIGTSPKTFGKVIRFQNILRAKPSTQSLQKNKLFYDVGYYDQAHFIKEFKHLYGVVPSKVYAR